jgi:hypothetical protein
MSALSPAHKQRQTLADVWNETSLLAPHRVVRRSILTGFVALAGFALNEGRWTYSILYLVVGCFGARALLVGRDGRAVRVGRLLLDVVATGATAVLVLHVLKLLFGGMVGVIRA